MTTSSVCHSERGRTIPISVIPSESYESRDPLLQESAGNSVYLLFQGVPRLRCPHGIAVRSPPLGMTVNSAPPPLLMTYTSRPPGTRDACPTRSSRGAWPSCEAAVPAASGWVGEHVRIFVSAGIGVTMLGVTVNPGSLTWTPGICDRRIRMPPAVHLIVPGWTDRSNVQCFHPRIRRE
jgi:hypothetical protein